MISCINSQDSKQSVSPRSIVLVLQKKESAWWPRLTAGAKPNFLKTDFSRWKDEDDEEEEAPGMGGI